MELPTLNHLKWTQSNTKHQESLCYLINNSSFQTTSSQNHSFPSKSSQPTYLTCSIEPMCLNKTSQDLTLQLRMQVKVSCLTKQCLKTSQIMFKTKWKCWLRMKFKFCTDLTTTVSIKVDADCSSKWFRMRIAMASLSLHKRRHSCNVWFTLCFQ